jgi:hypothetical protein
MTTVIKLTANFLTNVRGFQFVGGGGATWSFNRNTNAISLVVSGTDQSSQFTSKAWTDVLDAARVRISMDGKGAAEIENRGMLR